MPVTSPVNVYSNINKNVVELSGTGVPPSLLDEVQERHSGTCRDAGAAYRLVPAEIKHCIQRNNPQIVAIRFVSCRAVSSFKSCAEVCAEVC